jgi:hypothetical protein
MIVVLVVVGALLLAVAITAAVVGEYDLGIFEEDRL